MPFSFEFDAGHRILRARLVGRITDAELRETYDRLFHWVPVVKPAAVIFDGSEILKFDVSSETVRYLAFSDPPVPAGAPRFVVAPTDFFFGMVRMFQILGEEKRPDLRVVRSAAEAYRELGIAELHFEPLPQGQG